MLGALTGASLRLAELTANDAAPPSAAIFGDHPTGRLTMFSHDLPYGRTCQFWLMASDTRISVEFFTSDPDGSVLVRRTIWLAVRCW